jgi:hypothetical protein
MVGQHHCRVVVVVVAGLVAAGDDDSFAQWGQTRFPVGPLGFGEFDEVDQRGRRVVVAAQDLADASGVAAQALLGRGQVGFGVCALGEQVLVVCMGIRGLLVSVRCR